MVEITHSPALDYQSRSYPIPWYGKVPSRVKMTKTVRPDFPCSLTQIGQALIGIEYPVWVNSHGAVTAILPNGEKLGLKPDEFEIVEFHPQLSGVTILAARITSAILVKNVGELGDEYISA